MKCEFAIVFSFLQSRELEAWNLVNDELQLHGYHPVPVAKPSGSSLSKGEAYCKR